MSQRRQEQRRAQQERRREERRASRVAQRRTTTATTARDAPTAAEARSARLQATAAKGQQTNNRNLKIGGAALAGVAAVALIGFLVYQQLQPLPGEKIETNGNEHVRVGQEHGAYFSNPPTSGWHTDPIPRPGIYTEPQLPENLGHFMEHGGVWLLYTCKDGCPDVIQNIQKVDEARRNNSTFACPAGDVQCAEITQLYDITQRYLNDKKPVAFAPYPPKGYAAPEKPINLISWQYLLALDTVKASEINEYVERHTCRYLPEATGVGCPQGKRGDTAPAKDAGDSGLKFVAPPTPSVTATPAASPTASAAATPGSGPTPPPAATATPAPSPTATP